MKKDNKKIIIITALVFALIVITLNVIQNIEKDEIIVTHLYDIEIQKLDELDKYLVYDNGLIKFRDAVRDSDDRTNDYAVASKTTITYVASEDPRIKIYHVKYKNPIQEFAINRNKGKQLAEILVPAGTVKWSDNND